MEMLIYKGLSQILAFLTPFILLRIYGVKDFGLYSVLLAVISIYPLMDWGRSITRQNHVSRIGIENFSVHQWLWNESKVFNHITVNATIALSLWITRKFWLGLIMPHEMLQQVEGHSWAILGLLFMASLSGALYMGGSLINGLGHVNISFRISLLSNIFVASSLLLGWALSVPFDVMIVLAASGILIECIFSYAYCMYKRGSITRHSRLGLLDNNRDDNRYMYVSLSFLYLQMLSLVANNIDSLYLSRSASLTDIGVYAILLKIFSIPILITNVINSKYWPNIAAKARMQESDGGKHILIRLLCTNVLLTIVICAFLMIAINPIYFALVQKPLDHNILPWLFCIFVFMMSIRGPLTTYVNAAELIFYNIVGNTIFTIASLWLKVKFVSMYSIEGIVLANILAYIIFLLPFHVIAQKNHRNNLLVAKTSYYSKP
jgi:O-antigen/teichoic acid export membrane protein